MKKILFTAVCLCTLMFMGTAFAQSENKLSDAEVASVAVIANQIDIDYASLALKKTKNEDVKQFAETMSRDHKSVIKQATDLVTRLKVTPKENPVGRQMQTDAEKTMKMLESKSGDAFNLAYIDNEVAYHKAVINAVETVLIPESENAELKKLLQDILPALRAHLGHAEMLQKQLK